MTRMGLRRFSLFAAWALAVAARAAGSSVHVDDPGAMLPYDPPAAESLEMKLADFERTSGIRVLVRFHAKSPSAVEDAQPGAFMHALAGGLGVAHRGVLAVYFADEDDWRVWIGDELTARWVGRPGTVQELTASGAIHDAKEVFFAAAHAAAETKWTALVQSAPADHPPAAIQRVKIHADAIVDGLIAKFGA